MKVLARYFNIYLALALLPGLVASCETGKKKAQTAALRVHIEALPDAAGTSQPVSVLRSEPVLVNIKKEPILTEANLINAKVIEARGGFALELRFDENGTWLLEQYSAANNGQHFVVFGQWGEKRSEGRWLAAPFISRRISNGILVFTPDCSREEADQFVAGINEATKQIHKGLLK
ncbi:MAG TPA: hypothetical protein VMB80_13150 [Candidatus Acidoferrum sp.]|nr:hypothetical protein [Candidatus Acidoferrum sp.]